MNTNKTNRVLLNYVLLSLFCVIATIAVVILQHIVFSNKDHLSLNSGWTLETKGIVTEDVNPEKIHFIVARRGDTFVLKTTVPETDILFPVLCSTSHYCMVTAESGGRVIYEAGREQYENNTLSGIWLNQIPLDKLSPQRDITITYTVSEWNSVSSLPDHYIVTASEVFSDFLRREQFTFSVSVFLLFVGLIGSIIGFTSLILKKKIYPLIAISNFAFWCGMFMFCSNGHILLISHNYTLNTWLIYLSLYICPVTLIAVFYYQVAKSKLGKTLSKALGLVFILYLTATVLLQLCANVHLMVLIPAFNLLMLNAMIIAIIGRVRRLRADKGNSDIVNFGFLILIVYCIADWLRSVLYHMGLYPFSVFSTTYLGIGILVFVISSLLTYVSWLAEFTKEQSEQASWARVVERDATTGLPSKTKSMQMLQQMHDNDLEYAVVAFNIDNYDAIYAEGGDAAIEATLERYSKYVKKVFGAYGFCGRMGKNRFIVAAPEIPELKMKQLTYVFSKYMAREKAHGTIPVIESSLGLAFSRNCPNQEPLAICQMAEEGMQNVLLISAQRDQEVKLLTGEVDPKTED